MQCTNRVLQIPRQDSFMRIIKRYANRRLYDSETSRTITLDEVAKFIKDGEAIKVIDNISGENITNKVLGQAFLKIHEPGKTQTWLDGWCVNQGHISGSYVHGILDRTGFRTEFLNSVRRAKGLEEATSRPGRRGRVDPYDRLADHFEKYCHVDRMVSYIV